MSAWRCERNQTELDKQSKGGPTFLGTALPYYYDVRDVIQRRKTARDSGSEQGCGQLARLIGTQKQQTDCP